MSQLPGWTQTSGPGRTYLVNFKTVVSGGMNPEWNWSWKICVLVTWEHAGSWSAVLFPPGSRRESSTVPAAEATLRGDVNPTAGLLSRASFWGLGLGKASLLPVPHRTLVHHQA